jgi:hypothetical protein
VTEEEKLKVQLKKMKDEMIENNEEVSESTDEEATGENVAQSQFVVV